MRRKVITFILLLLPLFIFTSSVFAQENFRSSETSILQKDEVINKDYFGWGEKVTVSGTVNGDTYLAGGNIIVDGDINGDLLIAGGNIKVLGKVTGDIRSAGGNIDISGEVGGNVTAVGGNVSLDKTAKLKGSLVAGTGNLEVFAPIGKDLTVGAGTVTIASSIGSDALVGAENVDLNSDASVSGNLTYYSQNTVNIAKEATVAGKIVHNFPPKVNVPESEGVIKGVYFGWNLYVLISTFLVGLLITLVFPEFTNRTVESVGQKFWVSLGIGFLTLIVTPILIFILFVTLIAIPFAVLLLVSYFFLIFFAKIFTGLYLGKKMQKYIKQGENNVLALFLGLLGLGVLGLIPIIGGLVTFISMLVGLGAYLITKRATFLELRSKKII